MDIQKELDELLINLDSHNKLITQLGKSNMEVKPGFYMFDIYINGLLNRSVNLMRGFVSLMRDKNFISAAPLVRIHLDSLLRMYAPQLINFNVDEFAMQVYKGTPVRKIKSKDNKNMTDAYLVENLSRLDGFDWVKRVYETGNSFIHFSDQIIFSAMKAHDKERKMNFTIGPHDEFISINEKHGAAFWMNKITEGIFILVHGWIEQKKSYEKNGS